MNIRTLLAATAATALLASPAAAQVDGRYGGYAQDGSYHRGTPVQALPTPFSNGGSCVQWCVADATPCDPGYYKLADRRCNVNQNGYFPK